jgi:hypothetical protein
MGQALFCYEHAGRLGRAAEAPVETWVKPKGRLLPFCSRTIPKHPQRARTNGNQEKIEKCSSFRTFLARSEGYRQSL